MDKLIELKVFSTYYENQENYNITFPDILRDFQTLD